MEMLDELYFKYTFFQVRADIKAKEIKGTR
jgi:hypothetical protein